MSSLSQEDLDAGWDDADVAATAQPAVLDSNTIPPTSMTREKHAPLASLVVPAGEQASMPTDLPDAAAVPLEIGGVENTGFDDERHVSALDDIDSDRSGTASRNDGDQTALGDVHLSESGPGEPDAAQPSEAECHAPTTPGGGVAASAEDPSRIMGEVPSTSVQTAAAVATIDASIVTVTRELGWQDPEVESSAVQLEGQLPVDATSVHVAGTEAAPDPERLHASGSAPKRSLRWLIWSAVLVGIGIGYFLLQRTKHPTSAAESPPALRITESVSVPVSPRDSVVDRLKATEQGAAAPVPGNSAQSLGLTTVPLGGSFSDAFVKHAASVNSNWAEAKKRPRVVETQSASRPKFGVNASGENPLGVLDELEKARKAKKASSQP